MKHPLKKIAAVALLLASTVCPCLLLQAQGTAFTYQGRLSSGAVPANGSYDFTFSLFATNSGGVAVAASVTNNATPVSNGLFTAAINFGAGIFTGGSNWLELAVRTNGGGAFTPLTPRQQLMPAPYAVYAASAGAVSATNLAGALNAAQLPGGTLMVVTNGGNSFVNLARVFNGGLGGVTNLDISKSLFGSGNHLRFYDAVGSEQLWLHAAKNLDVETVNDGTFWVGHDYTATVDHDYVFHSKHDLSATVDNNLTETVHVSYSRVVDSNVSESVGNSMNLTVGNTLGVAANDLNLQANHNTTLNTINSRTDTVGVNLDLSVGNSLSAIIGNSMNLTVGNSLGVYVGGSLGLLPVGGTGVGTATPAARLHVYSPDNPTVVRIQSTGAPGFGRLEFVSNPQGDVNEWRPAFIQSLDAGGFTGGLGFYVNGTGAANKFSTNEVMRIQNGRVGIGISAPATLLQVGNATCNGTTWVNASDRQAKENFQAVDALAVLAKVAALPLSEWSYKVDSERHLGPMAQDFHAAFGLGPDDKHIATVDADGVALAAIQGLNQKLEAQRAENAELKQRLDALEKLLRNQKSN